MRYCVCTCVNDKFIRGAEIMLYSFLKNNEWFDGDVVVICGEEPTWPMPLSEENAKKLENIYHRTIIKRVNFSIFNDIVEKIKHHALAGTEPFLYTLPIFGFDEYDKIIFIDSDTLVLGSIKEAFDSESPMVICLDRHSGTNDEEWSEGSANYVNSGFFIVSKPYIQSNGLNEVASILDKIDVSKIKYADQDIINAYFTGKEVSIAPQEYNMPRFNVSQENISNVKILHFLAPGKPWEGITEGSYTDSLWVSYEADYEAWLATYEMNWGSIQRRYPKKAEDKDKYVVFACAKNEDEYIEEWVNHYLNLGFDKIFICDNNDTDSLEWILKDYITDGRVELFDCRKFTMFQGGVNKMFVEAGNYKWCAYFDCDEFLELNAYSNIKDFLETVDGDCVTFNWIMFGSNGQMDKEAGGVQERFKKPIFPIINMNNAFIKAIVRGGHFKYADILDCGGHVPVSGTKKITYNLGGDCITDEAPGLFQSTMPPRYKAGYIKHYYTKSFNEWLNKARRGWPLYVGSLPFYKYFYMNEDYQPSRKDYAGNLFIDVPKLQALTEGEVNFLKNEGSVVSVINEDGIIYAFLARVTYAMSQVEGGTFIVSGKHVDDTTYALLLECGFVTGNRVVFARNEKEVSNCFLKYKKPEDNLYFYKVIG